jgi:cob(I)alamin adenosyltransferase
MARTPAGVDLKKLARIGASARLAELEREIAALKRAFPGLKVLSVDVVEGPASVAAEAEQVARKVARRGRRKPMTAAERKAVSERMRKYWAERKKDRG